LVHRFKLSYEGLKMARWIRCGEKVIAGDVVRWRELVWGTRRKNYVKLGSRRVTAEVLAEDGKGFLRLRVLKCEVLDNPYARAGCMPSRKARFCAARGRRSGRGRASGWSGARRTRGRWPRAGFCGSPRAGRYKVPVRLVHRFKHLAKTADLKL
jgi:hypothetical protein